MEVSIGMPSVRALVLTSGLLGLFAFGGEARAHSRVLVLTTSGDADLGVLDTSIREAAIADDRFQVVGNLITPAIARREARCTVIDGPCLERLAIRRGADRVITGTVQPTRDDPGRVDVTLRLYDVFTHSTCETLVGSLEADDLESSRDVDRFTTKLVPLLARHPEEGTAMIRAVPGANVSLDGRSMGMVPANGELVLTPLRVGRRVLRVVRANLPPWEAPIIVRSRDSIRVTVDSGSALSAVETSRPSHVSGTPSDFVTIEPPPEWVLSIPGIALSGGNADVFEVGEGVTQVRFVIPLLEEHVASGVIVTSTHSRIGFLPNVSSSGARVTAKLRF